jgi:hypothetical protein
MSDDDESGTESDEEPVTLVVDDGEHGTDST